MDTDTTPSTVRVTMREPCKECGFTAGIATHTNGQDVVRCERCGTYAYCRPLSESGRPPTSTSTSKIKPKQRARVLAKHGHQCIACGRSPAVHGVVLDVDHIIPLAVAKRYGMLDELIESDVNMAPLCAECNRGKQDDIDSMSVQLVYRVLLLKRDHST